jgi:hypothetical protein
MSLLSIEAIARSSSKGFADAAGRPSDATLEQRLSRLSYSVPISLALIPVHQGTSLDAAQINPIAVLCYRRDKRPDL